MHNLTDVLDCGAERVAVVRGIMEVEQPTLVTQYFLSQMNRIQTLKAVEQRNVQSNA
jgi:thiamine-phosphate pyrophosphorylase